MGICRVCRFGPWFVLVCEVQLVRLASSFARSYHRRVSKLTGGVATTVPYSARGPMDGSRQSSQWRIRGVRAYDNRFSYPDLEELHTL